METVETLETSGGNTKTPLVIKKERIVPSKYWCFTAYATEMETLETKLKKDKKIKYIVGDEICPDTGRKHLQGYIECETKIRPIEYFKTKDVHWEKRKGTKNQNLEYCSKEGNYRTNMEMPEIIEDPMEGLEWYIWQEEIHKELMKKANCRDIWWLWEPKGCAGKTSYCKHMVLEHKALYVNGKANDVKCAIVRYKEEHERYPKIILWGMPRAARNIDYSAVEEIKDGMFFSGKYESGQCVTNYPHIVIFANREPDLEEMSLDKWKIKNLSDYKCRSTSELTNQLTNEITYPNETTDHEDLYIVQHLLSTEVEIE